MRRTRRFVAGVLVGAACLAAASRGATQIPNPLALLGMAPSGATSATGPVTPFSFPRDAGSHGSLCEWWYWNGHFGAEGLTHGFELCIFKALDGVLVCHVAVTDERGGKFAYDRFYCLPFDGAARRGELDLRCRKRDVLGGHDLQCWARRRTEGASSPGDQTVHGEVGPYHFTFDLATHGRKPLAVNGNGKIDMPEGGDSWYYSFTRLELSGTLERPGADGRAETVAVTGQAWMDHQWGQFVSLRRGWDWYSFQMEDGTDYNLFAMRKPVKGNFRYGAPSADTYANRLDAAGVTTTSGGRSDPPAVEVRPLQLWKGRTGTYAIAWEVVVQPFDEAFLVKARVIDQEVAARAPDPLPTYWEGSCDVWRRAADGTVTKGLAYVEHMPYPRGTTVVEPRFTWPDQGALASR